MKVAHFGNFAPNRAGIHSAARDLILAERSVGIESNYIDYGSEVDCTFSRVWMKDGEVTTVSPDWAIDEADIIVHHSAIPPQVEKTGKPTVMYLHGRPEYSFMLDWMKKTGCMREEIHRATLPQYKKFITFWEEHLNHWKYLFPDKDVGLVPPPIDLKTYSIEGKTHQFKPEENGSPNILICDMWREDITPFNSVIAAMKFAELYCPTAKIHVIAVPMPGQSNPVIDIMFGNLRKSGYLGRIATIIKNLDEVMRASDILVSPVGIETRTILEASALGLPVVAGTGCKLASFTSDPRNINNTVVAIRKCWEKIKSTNRITIKNSVRKRMEKNYGLKKTGNEVRILYEEILDGKKQLIERTHKLNKCNIDLKEKI